MSHACYAIFTIKPELMAEFQEFMKGENGLCKTRGWPGCREITCAIGGEENNVFNIWEKWVSKADWEAYFAWRGETGFGDLAAKFFAAPPAFHHATIDVSL